MSQLDDPTFERLKAQLNETIHELVFAVRHLDDDQVEKPRTPS